MASKKTSIDSQAESIVEGMLKAKISVGKELTAESVRSTLTKVEAHAKEADDAARTRAIAVNAREAARRDLRTVVKRVRALVKGTYGEDSTEYELVGGTRTSERKKPVRRLKSA